MSHAMRVIAGAIAILMEEQGMTHEQASAEVSRTIEALGDGGRAKLTPGEVREVEDAYASGFPGSVVGNAYGISARYANNLGREAQKNTRRSG